MYSNWLTKFSTIEEFWPERPITRGEASKFVVSYAEAIWYAKVSENCIFDDITWYDSSLEPFMIDACKYWLITWHDWSYFPRSYLTEAQALTIAMRTVGWHQDETWEPRYNLYYTLWKEYWLVTNETMDSVWSTNITRAKFGRWLVTLGKLHQLNYFENSQQTTWSESETSIQTWEDPTSQSNIEYSSDTNTYTFNPWSSNNTTNSSQANQSNNNQWSQSESSPPPPTSLWLDVMTVDERFWIGLEDEEWINFYSIRVRPIISSIEPKNLIIQTSISENHCLDFPKLNLPEGFTYISTNWWNSWKVVSTVTRKTSEITRNPMLCGPFLVKIIYPEDYSIFDRGLGFSFLETEPEESPCQTFLVSSDNTWYLEEEVCYDNEDS